MKTAIKARNKDVIDAAIVVIRNQQMAAHYEECCAIKRLVDDWKYDGTKGLYEFCGDIYNEIVAKLMKEEANQSGHAARRAEQHAYSEAYGGLDAPQPGLDKALRLKNMAETNAEESMVINVDDFGFLGMGEDCDWI